MYTKEEMITFTTCVAWVECKDCPFEKINAGLLFKPDCYKENIDQYKKEKEMEESKAQFKKGNKALYVGHGLRHFTNGKVYDVVRAGDSSVCFIDDEGDQNFITSPLNSFSLVGPTPSHPFKQGVKYFTRDKKSWRRFIGEDLDQGNLVFSREFGSASPRMLGGNHFKDREHYMDVLPEEWIEPTPEPKTEMRTFYKFETYNKKRGTVHVRPDFWSLEKTPIPMHEDEVLTDTYEAKFNVPMEKK